MSQPGIRIESDSRSMSADNGIVRVECSLASGLLDIRWQDGKAITGLFAELTADGERLRSAYYSEHKVEETSIVPAHDAFGRGIRWTFEHEMPGKPVLRQLFRMYEGLPYVFAELEAESETVWETNEMAPLAALSNDGPVMTFGPGASRDIRALFVPFDNDKWVRYGAYALPCTVDSHEATAVYEAESGRGFVLGSVTHDFWKTGIRVEGAMAGEVTRLRIFGGAAGLHTRDTVPHGSARGKVNVSPRIFVGAFHDYRDGLTAYGRANEIVEPKLPWDGGVPFGWNSWSAVMGKLDFDVYAFTSDFIRRELQDGGFSNEGVVYINFDAFWNRLTPEELSEAVRRVKANGQKPGIYCAPFAYWGKNPDVPVEGYEGQYVYRDLLLKDDAGNLLPTIAGAHAIDLSHPVTLERIRRQLEQFAEWGFEYVKADFLSHGALEGKHHDPEIRSGIQAYRLGMAAIRDTLSPERTGRPIFINLSISPLFPHGYAHSRRMSCDVFGLIGDTEYLLNALTYGWWANDTLYRFNDPDHTVLYKSDNQHESAFHEGRSRLTASLIAGTSLLLGDDYRMEDAASRARLWLTHSEAMDVARKGVTFRPAKGSDGSKAGDLFTLQEDDVTWVAVFNFDAERTVLKRLPRTMLGISADKTVSVRDIWDETERTLQAGTEYLEISLAPSEAKLLKIMNR